MIKKAQTIVNRFNLNYIIRAANKKELLYGKVPLTAVVISTIDVSSTNASCTFIDNTGQMNGTLHRKLVKDYGNILQEGTAMQGWLHELASFHYFRQHI